MRGSHKSKRITWASDLNLCQIKLFLSEEPPSQVGIKTRNHPQTMPFWPGQSVGNEPNDNLPPGFEGIHQSVKLSQIPLTKWRCPPRIEINSEWQVVAGEESNEIKAENQRETRVLESIYPWPSAIPPNPSVLAEVANSTGNDQNTPRVPLTPIEEGDASLGTLLSSHANGTVQDTKPIESMIDSDLLMKILSNPKLVEQLVTSNGGPTNKQTPLYNNNTHNNIPSSNLQSKPAIGSQRVGTRNTASITSPHYIPNSYDPTKIGIKRTDHPTVVNGPFYPSPQTRTAMGAPMKKDVNYYKSLIQLHGGEKRDVLPQFVHQDNRQMMINQQPISNFLMKSRESSNPKIMTRPCVYFNTPKGCRHGANCTYQHDTTSYQHRLNGYAPEVQIAKRVKLDREITGI
ncbi:hypothetical protein ABFX02_14G301700 [Erythranthe guttata]